MLPSVVLMLAISMARLAATVLSGPPVVPPPPPPPARLPLVRRISTFWATALEEGGGKERLRESERKGKEGGWEGERMKEKKRGGGKVMV